MQIRCPSCQNPLEILDDSSLTDIDCPSCDSRFNLLDDDTLTYREDEAATIGHFLLQEKLGSGAFGTVWKARDNELDRQVAIKIPRKEQLSSTEAEQFVREARAAAQLKHPNIVSVHEVGKETEQFYIVSDLIDGLSLADWLTGQRLTVREAALLCTKLAAALEHAHDSGVIHRDLKPSNILIDHAGEPHVMDFGLAKREVGEVTMTTAGQVLGTPAYMSPEQAKGESHDADARSDIYSLGVILFELLTHERPFRGNTRMLLHQVIHDEAQSPRILNSNIPRDLETICLKCLQKDPGQRYATAGALGDDLQRFLNGEAVVARPIGQAARLWRWCRRNRLIAALTAAVAAVLIVGIALSSYFAIEANTERNTAIVLASEKEKLAREMSQLATDESAARKQAERNRIVAEDARQEATRNLRRAHEVVDKYLLKVAEDPRLKAQALESLRRDLLSFARQFYEEALSGAAADPELLAVQADTYFRLGRLTELVESRDAAIGDYEKGRDVYRRLVKDHPDRSAYQAGLAQCLNNIGLCYRETGRLDASQPYLDESFTIRNKLAEKFPEDDTLRMELAQIQNNLAINASDRGNAKEAARLFGEAADVLQVLFDKAPSSFTYQDRLARYRFNLGRTWLNLGDTRASAKSLHRALELRLELAQELPGLAQVQSDLVYSYLELGNLASSLKRTKDSIEHANNAREQAERLVHDRPDIDEYVMLLAQVNQRLSELHFNAGQLEQAIERTAAIIEGLQSVLDRGRRPQKVVFQLAQAYNDRGFMRQQLGQNKAVEQDYLRSVELGDELLKEYPHLVGRLRVRSQARLNLAAAYRAAEKYDEAFRWNRAAVDAANESLKAAPNNGALLQDVANGWYGQAAARGLQERYVEAVHFYDLAIPRKSGLNRLAVTVERTVAVAGMKAARKEAEGSTDHAALASRAKQIAADDVQSALLAYHAAAHYGLAARAAVETKSQLFAEYSQNAVAALERVEKQGFFKMKAAVERVRTDAAFASLRDQAAFQQFIKGLLDQQDDGG